MTPPDAARPTSSDDPLKRHRRQMRRWVYGPVFLGVLVIVTAVVLVLTLAVSRASLVADLMLSCLVFVPMLICLFPLYLVMIVAAISIGRGRQQTQRRMDGLRQRSGDLAARAETLSDSVNQRMVGISARLAVLNVLFGIFDSPDDSSLNRSDAHDDPS